MRLVKALETVIDLALNAAFRIEARGVENFTHSPSTLVVANHRRDSDGPIICGVLLERRWLKLHGVVPNFVAREDLFRKGFLVEYFLRWPKPLRKLLSKVDLKSFLWLTKAYPMRRVPERTLGEVLDGILRIFGDLPLEEVLRRRWIQEFPRCDPSGEPPECVSQAMSGRYRPLLRTRNGLTKLTRSRFHELKPYERATIASHLGVFVDLLEKGENVQLEPEGMVSVDGSFSPMRAGLHYLLNKPKVKTRVLPVGITYDFMIAGRTRVFVNVGPEMTDLQGLSRRVTDKRVAEAILAQLTVTASQLASRLLLAARSRGEIVTASQVLDHVALEASRCTEAGAYVDPRLLADSARSKRVYQYLEYCVKSGTLVSCGRGRYRVRNGIDRPRATWSNPEGVIDYLNNELSSLTRLWPEVLESIEA